MTETITDLTQAELARLRVLVKTHLKRAEDPACYADHSQGYIDQLHSILRKLR